ncbi:hypothetical protein VTI74DRAFT_6181 [Chaetomium olivicolor]
MANSWEHKSTMNWKPSSSGSSTPLSPASPLSPLSSPTLSNLPHKLRNRIPTQIRRIIPYYLIGAFIFTLIFKAQVYPAPQPQPAHLTKRQTPQQQVLSGSNVASPPSSAFPKKIWQSWKTDPLNFDKRDSDTARTWTLKNPSHRYEVLTDANDMVFVEAHFGAGSAINRPDIVDLYRTVNITIVKADLLRYMVMYAEGGVYADIDVEALKPVDRFIPARYDPADIDMIIGVEIDQPEFRDHPILGQKCMSFCQWTFVCRPGLSVMLRLIENIMAWINGVAAKQGVAVSEVVLDFDEVISGTGPSAFTAAVLEEMNKAVPAGGKKITWDTFHAMDESKVVSRVLVLDVEKFAAGQGHSDSGNHNARGALVKHHYHASNWPSKHPRYNHPAYGEVEKCNWDAACVKKWDEDVEAYKLLSTEEQNKIIEQRSNQDGLKLEEAKKEQEKAEALERLVQAAKRQEEEAKKRAEDVMRGANGGQQQQQQQPAFGFGAPPPVQAPPPQAQFGAPAPMQMPAPQQQQQQGFPEGGWPQSQQQQQLPPLFQPPQI